MSVTFPEGFIWGTATAAHQVEGGNWNNDWWEWEHTSDRVREPSGDACDQYNRYEEDLDLLAGFGFNSYRFSIEWARIEPEDGEFSRVALDHYRRVCAACHERGITPIVTFHHFTSPRWVAARGGWAEAGTAELFGRYVTRATSHLGDLIGRACTINEPSMVATGGYLSGVFPPGKRDREARYRANATFIDAHHRAVEAIRSGPGDAPVGICLAMSDYQAVDGGDAYLDRIRTGMEDVFLDALDGDDFVGVQCYSRTRVGPSGALRPEPGVELTQMGYEFWPESLEATIRRAYDRSGGVPVVVTENGIGTDDDTRRIEYTRQALQGIRRCLNDGIDVLGYVHWTLLDNFEWAEGYRPTFGLVGVDRKTFERRPKPSASWLGHIARAGTMD
ncbi:MAG TPA: glycoside hydrolase family 1 protein [Acidimicrobiales bacterium]|nr:glycoside hydrolase family 1 protein [Acidimicrobiales bacterium]